MNVDLEKVPPIKCNPAQLREVATNLIFNPVDAMPEGGAITLRTWNESSQVVLEVSDTGVGMSEEVRARCIEPFFFTKGDKGTRFGLAMVFGIIKRYESTPDIESAPWKGTTFRIQFPAQTPS